MSAHRPTLRAEIAAKAGDLARLPGDGSALARRLAGGFAEAAVPDLMIGMATANIALVLECDDLRLRVRRLEWRIEQLET